MKTLAQHINEWKLNDQSAKTIDKKSYYSNYFIYKIYGNEQIIKIFDQDWPQFNNYKDKVYINGKHVELDNHGRTTNLYKQGEYKIEIKDINDVINCRWMFYTCKQLVSVPLFDTSNVKNMYCMFMECINLESVPLLNTSKVVNMDSMFYECHNLNEETIQEWSKIYDF